MPIALAWLAGPFVLAAAALPLLMCAPDKSRAELEPLYPGEYRLVDGVRLRLRDTGPAHAPAIVMLHGFASSLETWEPWAQLLSARFRVVRFDLPGFGLSGLDPTGDYSDAREVSILAELMRILGVERATLVGSSMGGRIAWSFAARHPDRVSRMVLVSPDGFANPGFPHDRAPAASAVLRALTPYFAPPASLLRLALAAAYGRPEALSQATLKRYRDLLLAPGVRRAITSRMEQMSLRDPAPVLARIEAPTLLIWGEKDSVIPIGAAKAFLHDLVRATLVRLPGLGHVPFEEDPLASFAPLQKFLADARPQ